MPYLSLAELLNPQSEVDTQPTRPQGFQHSLVPPQLSQNSAPRISFHGRSAANGVSPASATRTSTESFPAPPLPEVRYNVKINRKTTLSVLNTFNDTRVHIEYPATNADQPVGYLFRQDPANWRNPTLDFAYSLGRPSGGNRPGEEVYCGLLVDKDDVDSLVPCSKRHMTCQGSKICPMADVEKWKAPHQNPSLNDIRSRMKHERDLWLESVDPRRDTFQKTAAFIAALRKIGCKAPRREETTVTAMEKAARQHESLLSRGYSPLDELCEGTILLEFDQLDHPLVRCQHYNPRHNRDHFIQYLDDSYNVEYLEAYFYEDTDELSCIEEAVQKLGYGPLAKCTTIANVTSQRAYCPFDHRDDSTGQLRQQKMQHMPCAATYHLFEPLPESRTACPWSLVVCRGVHTHPIPIPQKTPPFIRQQVIQVLESLDHDLADLTPRRFLRHPVLKTYLASELPDVRNPTLCDLHISLANRSHVRYYIDQITAKVFPFGTGWEGAENLMKLQRSLPDSERYIRRVIKIPHAMVIEDEDEPSDYLNIDGGHASSELQVIICMTPDASKRMKQARYLQSDIGFKRVTGFYEFEIGSLDRESNTSITFCRVFLNRQTAFAHQKVLEMIDEIVKEDTGFHMTWHHIHGRHINDFGSSVLQWTGDQHGGQAKGLGLYLQVVSQRPEVQGKFDFHHLDRPISSLSAYEHLHRIFRLCTVHAKRNIRKLSVSEDVRNLMRSLICLEHNDWEGTIQKIVLLGGKVGADWVKNKVQSNFAFEALCWEKSRIPLPIWKAGDSNSNLIETNHSDVNREGIHCTLLGGIKKGQMYDSMKLQSLQASESLGVRPSYSSGHVSVNANKNLKRKFNARHRMLESQDEKIERHNELLQAAHQKLEVARYEAISGSTSTQAKLNRATTRYDKQVEIGKALAHTGSGTVGLLLPGIIH